MVNALPSSFMDQGEFGSASSIADVVEVECEEVYAEKDGHDQRHRALQPLRRATCTGPRRRNTTLHPVTRRGAELRRSTLDNDGNATAVVFGGPSCAAGESLIAAHLDVAPFTTAVTAFDVLPPRPTEPGVKATPAKKVEGEINSDVATIVQVEFPPVFAEEPVNINAAQLYSAATTRRNCCSSK